MFRKFVSTLTALALILAIGGGALLYWKNSHQASPLICGGDQIKVTIKGERSLADILAETRPDVAVGTVAKLMNYEPTIRLSASTKAGESCLTISRKLVRAGTKSATGKTSSASTTSASQGN